MGNARYVDGRATGDLDDVVKGLGGDVVWDKLKSGATIYDPDGNIVSYLTKAGNKIIEKDTKGNIIKRYSTEGGNAQADIEGFAGRFDVPYSYYHDKNGVYRAYSQPEMRGAPITVVRKEGDVYIEANVEFTGKHANEIYPGTEVIEPASGRRVPGSGKTYAEIAYQSILDSWNTGSSYNISGKNIRKDADGNIISITNVNNTDTVKLHASINSNSEGLKNMTNRPKGYSGQSVTIDIGDRSQIWGASHVLTIDPKDLSPKSLVKIRRDPITNAPTVDNHSLLKDTVTMYKNVSDALQSGQYERAMYNWTIKNPGKMWLYNTQDANHEFAHMLGLGDAHNAAYRIKAEAPEEMARTNQYGEKVTYYVPREKNDPKDPYNPIKNVKGDIMRGYTTVTDADMSMMLDAWRTGQPQFFDKDPKQVAATKEEWTNTVKKFPFLFGK